MGGGKGKAPPPPDYSQIAAANKEAAEISAQVSREQLAWAKEQYATDRADTTRVTDSFLSQMDEQNANARADRARYEEKYQGQEDKLLAEADSYGTAQRQEAEAGKAAAEVDRQFEAARQGSEARLASFGMDPTQIRSGALDLGTRVAEATAKAGAANAGREQAINTGRALRSEAINIGRGYPAQVAQSVAAAQQAGTGTVQANLNTTLSGSQTMGSPVQWAGLQNQALGNWGDYSSRVYSAQQAARAQQSNIWGGVGTLAGAALSKIPFSDERVKEGIVPVGKLDNGLTVYEFNYKGDPTRQIGLIAQEVEQSHPEAVHEDQQGVKMVDYDAAVRTDGGQPGAQPGGQPAPGGQPQHGFSVPHDVVLRKGTEFFDKLVDKTRGIPTRGASGKGKAAQAAPSDGVDDATLEALVGQIVPTMSGANQQRGIPRRG